MDPYSTDTSLLRQAGLDEASVATVGAIAALTDVPLGRAATATGLIDPHRYALAVGRELGIPLLPVGTRVRRLGVGVLTATVAGQPAYVVEAEAGSVQSLRQAIHALPGPVFVADRAQVDAAVEASERTHAIRRAIIDLKRRHPHLSAATPLAPWQSLAIAVLAGLTVGGLAVAPAITLALFLALLTFPFVSIVLVRLVALVEVLRSAAPAPAPPLSDAALPSYAVLVPLFDEAAVLGDLVAALRRLDYPAPKLDLVLVLEETDQRTRAALSRLALPANMRVVVVPDTQPRTKPKALNYALQLTRSEMVVVYDAEDRPEAAQLRLAAAMFANAPQSLGCVQARLNIYNPADSWLARQFTIEYSALFDAILPALDRLGLPVPLGGTSNHFRRAVLERVGGWDPFNVTEDADLGIRLARLGYTTRVLASTTWEEAPVTWGQWLPQRTRWLKGWFQTYAVHTRQPARLRRDLGPWRTFGFHVFLGGVLLSTLVHPLFYLVLVAALLSDQPLALPGAAGPWIAWLGWMTLALGYLSAMAVGLLAVRRRAAGLWRSAVAMPAVWMLISVAAYRALWQLRRDPYLWEKTIHGRARRRAAPQFRRGPTSGRRRS